LPNGSSTPSITKIVNHNAFGESNTTVETYVQDFSESIYNTKIKIDFKKIIAE